MVLFPCGADSIDLFMIFSQQRQRERERLALVADDRGLFGMGEEGALLMALMAERGKEGEKSTGQP